MNREYQSTCIVVVLLAGIVSEAIAETGEHLYQRHCSICHQTAGTGVPSAFPPLTDRLGTITSSQPGRDYVAMVVQAGLVGTIWIDGVKYQGVMPPQGSVLDDEGIAAVLNFTLQSFNNNSLPDKWQRFTKEEIVDIKSRHLHATPQAVHAMRRAVFRDQPSEIALERAREHWVMRCQGCHGADAQGTNGGAPRMAGIVAQFLHVEEGRAYLAQVPGVAFAPLSDSDLADLLNWVVTRFDAEHVPPGFQPYREDEIRMFRQRPLISQVHDRRRKILESVSKSRSAQ